MSKIEVDAVEPQSGTTLTLGASGDTITIPAGATISNSGTAAGFGPTGAVSWNTTKITADPNPAVTGVGYFADTTSAAFTITLPASPSAGAIIGIRDYAQTFATNNLTVGRNSQPIDGQTFNLTLNTNGESVILIYVDSTQGWKSISSNEIVNQAEFVSATGGTITTCGNYKIHTFTGPGTFTVCRSGNPAGSTTVDYLVVAGGGAGGTNIGGGGGAGGFRESVPSPAAWTASPLANPGGALPVTVTAYPITVGAGGAGGARDGLPNSGNSSIFSSITSTGGGFGGTHPTFTAANGGSGGGGNYAPSTPGSGNTPPTSPPQGNNGGAGVGGPVNYAGGGGGGASATGAAGGGPSGGPGGNGATTSISGSPTAYAGGGGGSGSFNNNQVGGTGGSGGGGTGQRNSPAVAATDGGTNLGGGGGGKTNNPCVAPGKNGGSGIVVIRYKFQ
jgi:hypothetical protein